MALLVSMASGDPSGMKRIVCAIVIVAAVRAFAQPSLSPVPPPLLQGNTLRVEEANVLIPAPGPEWEWARLNRSTPVPDEIGSFVVRNPNTGEYFIASIARARLDWIEDEYVRGVLASVRASSREAWQSLRNDFVDFPVRHTLHYSYLGKYAAGTAHTYAYLVPTGGTVTLQTLTSASTEPPNFTAFVKSVRTLRPVVPTAPVPPGETSSVSGYLAILFLSAGIAGLVNKRKGRIVVNAFKVAAWTVGLVLVADLALAIFLIETMHITNPASQVSLVGGVLTGGVFPFVVALLLAWRNARRVTDAAVAGGASQA